MQRTNRVPLLTKFRSQKPVRNVLFLSAALSQLFCSCQPHNAAHPSAPMPHLNAIVGNTLDSTDLLITRSQDQESIKNANNSWKNVTLDPQPLVTQPPHFKAPEDFDTLTTEHKSEIQNHCESVYENSLQALEDSIADAAVQESHTSQSSIKKTLELLTDRLNDIFQFQAENEVKATGEQDPQKRAEAIQQKYLDSLKTTLGSCSAGEGGCLGAEVHRILKAFKEGNLRERMFLVWRGASILTPYLTQPALSHSLNEALSHKGWQLQTDVPVKGAPFMAGVYIDRFRHRIPNTPEAIENFKKQKNLTLKDFSKRRLPLSERELEFLTQDQKLTLDSLDPAIPGEAVFNLNFEAVHSPKNPYDEQVEALHLPKATGISGTTDYLLTIAHYLGMTDPEDLKRVLILALGWMLDPRDHSANEILTAGNSFYLHYQFTPTYYRDFFHLLDDEFVRKTEENQRARGVPLPQEVLDHCLLNEIHSKKDHHTPAELTN